MIGQTLLDRYRVVGKLGEGGFGSVYEAEHLELGSRIAIKVLESGPRPTEESVHRFLREGQVLSRITHPCAVKVFDRGLTNDGRVWMAMELLHGETLDQRLRRGAIPAAEVVELFRPLCELLAEAHGKGIVHRDLKPHNVMLVPVAGGGVLPKLFDFGIAGLGGDDSITDPELVSGTPRYMAPEQWEGLGHADARSDVYSLGVILYECLSGQLPLEADSTVAWLAKHRYQEPRDLRDAMQGRPLPAGVRRVIMRALAKNPDERQQGTLELAAQLAGALADGPAEPPAPRPSRRRWYAGGAAAAAVIAVAGAVAWRGHRGPASVEAAGTRAGCQPLAGSYMPLAVGNWWRYQVRNPSTLQPLPLDKTIAIDRQGDIGGLLSGIDAFRLFRRDSSGTAYRWLDRHDQAIVWRHDEWFDTADRPTRAVFYLPYRLRVDDACPHRVADAAWRVEYDEVDYDAVRRTWSTIHRAESWQVEAVDEEIVVPAGTFRCLRLHRRSLNDARYTDSTYWFAAGVGKVREDSPTKELEVLVAYHVE